MQNVNNMAEAGQICNIACLHVVTDFLFPEEEESLLEGNHEDMFVIFQVAVCLHDESGRELPGILNQPSLAITAMFSGAIFA